MSEPASMEQETDQALARLMALGLAAAEHVQARLLAAETDAEIATRTMAFVRAARLVRQTAALRAKLARDAARDQARERREDRRDAEAKANDPRVSAMRAMVVEERKALLRETVEEMVWDEVADDEKAERLADALDRAVDRDAVLDPEFLNRPLDTQVAALRRELGLDPRAPAEEAPPEAEEEPWGSYPASNSS